MADSKEDEQHPQSGQKGKGRSSEPPGPQLPLGWERRVTEHGRTYYIDHNTRSTSWTLPPNERGHLSSLNLPAECEERVDINGQTLDLHHNTCTPSWSISASTNDKLQQLEDQRKSSNATSSIGIPAPSVSGERSEDALWESFGSLFDSERKHLEEVLSPEGFKGLLQLEEARLGSALSSAAEPAKIPTLSTVRDELSKMPSHAVRLHLFVHARSRYIQNKIFQNQAIVDAAVKPIAHILGFAAGMIFQSAMKAAQNLSILKRPFIQQLHYDLQNSERGTVPAILGSLAAELFESTVARLRTGDIASIDSRRYLDMAIETAGRATMLLPEKSPGWASMVYWTAVMHRTKFSQFASEADLHLALRLAISAFEILPKGHDQYTKCLDHIIFLYARLYEHGGGDSIYLAEALRLARVEVSLAETAGADVEAQTGKMSRLADLLLKLFQRERDSKTLDEALEILNQANGFGSGDLHVRADLTFNLGRVYMMRFSTSKDEADLIEGLKNHHKAIRIIPQGHPSCGTFYLGLVSAYKTRYDKFSSLDDLVTASSLAQKIFSMVDVNDKLLAMVCVELGVCLQKAFERTEKDVYFENSVRMFEAARSVPEAPLMVRLCSSTFAGYLLIAKHRWMEAFRAFLSAVNFLEQLATNTITRDDQQKVLQQFGGVSAMAAAVALEAGAEPWVALQTLERGRGVILNISLNRQSDISEIKKNHPGLYDEYMLLRHTLYSKLLPDDTPEDQGHGPAIMPLRVREQQRKIQQLEERIQRELGPKVFHRLVNSGDFQRLAIPGPIIAFNTTNIRSDAFIITDEEVKSIRLQELELEKLEQYMALLTGPEAVIDGSAATRDARNTKFESFLEWLWVHAVLPVLQDLNFISPNPPTELPRIWWVANGLLGLTPLHAAGLPRKLKHSTSSHVISSFVPTLRALSRAREKSFNLRCFNERPLIVTMRETKGLADLKTSKDEESITSNLPLSVKPETLESPTKAQVLEKLEKSSAVFFSCHGEVDPVNPANSGLLLGEGSDSKPERLTFRDLSDCETNLGKLACLLACSTATSSNELLVEEMLHVVSGFQLAGFPHVIGTLWPVGDKTTNDVLEAFMQHLSNGGQDDAAIARALHYAVNTRRISGRQLSKNVIAWAPFIHFGC